MISFAQWSYKALAKVSPQHAKKLVESGMGMCAEVTDLGPLARIDPMMRRIVRNRAVLARFDFPVADLQESFFRENSP
jgi:hypothetical protein